MRTSGPDPGADPERAWRELRPFAGLPAARLDELAPNCRLVPLSRGQVLFRQGEPAEGLFLLLSGRLQLTRASADGHEKVIELVRPGETFAEAALFSGRPLPVSAAALIRCEVLLVAQPAVDELLATDPGFARRLLAAMADRLYTLVADLQAFSGSSAVQRLAAYLIEAATDPQSDRLAQGREDATGPDRPEPQVQLPVGKRVLASRLSLTAETLSRALHELSVAGLVSVRGRQVIIHDLAGLRRRVGRT